MSHTQVARDKHHALLDSLVTVGVFCVFLVQLLHHVAVEMLDDEDLVLERGRVIQHRVTCALAADQVSIARRFDKVKVSVMSYKVLPVDRQEWKGTHFMFGDNTILDESLKWTQTEPSVIAKPMPYLPL